MIFIEVKKRKFRINLQKEKKHFDLLLNVDQTRKRTALREMSIRCQLQLYVNALIIRK